MKKIATGIVLSISLLFSQTLEERVEALEKDVTSLKTSLGAMLRLKSKLNNNKTTEPTKEINNPLSCRIDLVEWEFKYGKGSYSEYYNISYTIKNNHDKAIKLIDGSLRFQDLLGESIYGIKLTKDVDMKPKQISIYKGQYSINEFIAEQNRMKKMKKNDIKTTLDIRKIVLEDNIIVDCSK